MGKVIVAIVMLVIGLGAGFGAGYMLMMPRINESATEIDTLKEKLETAEADADAVLKKAGKEIADTKEAAKIQIKKIQNSNIDLSNELVKVKQERDRYKSLAQQAVARQAESAPTAASVDPAPATVAPTVSTSTPASTATPKPAVSASGQTVEYTVAEGDSLWKIAESQLGSGIRYKEILTLNPAINENTRLNIGMKLKLPAK